MDNQPLSFKTSLYGFHKQDVIDYIEQFNTKYHKMETKYTQEIEKIKKDSVKADSIDYEQIINELKAENENLKKQLDEMKPDTYREKAELYDKMSGQLGSMIIMANDKADDIINNASKKVDDAKQNINSKVESLNNQLYNEFVVSIESYMEEITELNKTMNSVIDTLNVKSEESKEKFEKKALKLRQALLKEINELTLFNTEIDYE